MTHGDKLLLDVQELSEIKYGKLVALQHDLGQEQEKRKLLKGALIKEEVDDLRAQNEQINKMKVKPKFLISCKGDY